MGVNTLDALAIGGGVPFSYALSTYQPAYINTRHFQLPPAHYKDKKVSNQVKKGAKVNIYLIAFVYPSENRRQREAKT